MSGVLCVWVEICLVRNWIPDLWPTFLNDPYKEREILPHRISLQSLEKSVTLSLSNKRAAPDSTCSSLEPFGNAASSLNRHESSSFITETRLLRGNAEPQHTDHAGHSPSTGPKAACRDGLTIRRIRFSASSPPTLAPACWLGLKSLWGKYSFSLMVGERAYMNIHTLEHGLHS